MGQQLGLPVINMSFGAGWTAANNWQGDYPRVGNLSDVRQLRQRPHLSQPRPDPGRRHPAAQRARPLAAAGRPGDHHRDRLGQQHLQPGRRSRNTSWMPHSTASRTATSKLYYYALFDDGSGNFGLMNQDGTPKTAGTALHDLITLLADTGPNAATFTPGSLSFTLSGNQSTDNTLLIQKSNGSDWLALWDETAGTHTVTLTLALDGMRRSWCSIRSPARRRSPAPTTPTISVSLGNDPLLIEVIGASGSAAAPAIGSGPTGGGTGSGRGSSEARPPTRSPRRPGVTVPAAAASPEPAPCHQRRFDCRSMGGQQSRFTALTVSASNGDVTMLNASGSKLAGSGTGDDPRQRHAGPDQRRAGDAVVYRRHANGTINVDIWDQAGVEANKSFDVTVERRIGGSGSSSSGSSTASSDRAEPRGHRPGIGNRCHQQHGGNQWGVDRRCLGGAASGYVGAERHRHRRHCYDARRERQRSSPGSGTSAIHVSGTLVADQRRTQHADLYGWRATGTGSATVDIWDQAGVEATKSIA